MRSALLQSGLNHRGSGTLLLDRFKVLPARCFSSNSQDNGGQGREGEESAYNASRSPFRAVRQVNLGDINLNAVDELAAWMSDKVVWSQQDGYRQQPEVSDPSAAARYAQGEQQKRPRFDNVSSRVPLAPQMSPVGPQSRAQQVFRTAQLRDIGPSMSAPAFPGPFQWVRGEPMQGATRPELQAVVGMVPQPVMAMPEQHVQGELARIHNYNPAGLQAYFCPVHQQFHQQPHLPAAAHPSPANAPAGWQAPSTSQMQPMMGSPRPPIPPPPQWPQPQYAAQPAVHNTLPLPPAQSFSRPPTPMQTPVLVPGTAPQSQQDYFVMMPVSYYHVMQNKLRDYDSIVSRLEDHRQRRKLAAGNNPGQAGTSGGSQEAEARQNDSNSSSSSSSGTVTGAGTSTGAGVDQKVAMSGSGVNQTLASTSDPDQVSSSASPFARYRSGQGKTGRRDF